MGCWNETCNLSGLPIVLGEKVKVLLTLGKNNVLFYPFVGEYDEYGCVDGIEEDDNTCFISETISEANSFKFKYKDHQKEYIDGIEEEGFKGLVKAIERGLVRGNVWGREDRVGLVFIKEDVYSNAVKAYGETKDYSGKTMNDLMKKRKNTAIRENEVFKENGVKFMSFSSLDINFCSPSHSDMGFVYKVGLDGVVDLSIEMRMLFSVYNNLRKDLDVVEAGRGSQDSNFDFWREMNKIFLKSCDEDQKEYEKEY